MMGWHTFHVHSKVYGTYVDVCVGEGAGACKGVGLGGCM